MRFLIVMCIVLGAALADVSHVLNTNPYEDYPHHGHGNEYEYPTTTTTSTPPPPPKPYIFSYTAGRYAGHVDRTHTEVSDGSGTVRGAFSYVDPRQEVRTVEYVADQYGFHPLLSHPVAPPKQSEAVLKATERHYNLYNRIAADHANPHPEVTYPRDSASVEFAKQKHLTLFEQIAADHARIGAEQEAQRLAFEATSVPNDIEENNQHYYPQQ